MHAEQPPQLDLGADLLAGFPDRRFLRGLADLDAAAQNCPFTVVAGVLDEQDLPGLTGRQHRDRREQQQVMPDGHTQPADMRRHSHARHGRAPAHLAGRGHAQGQLSGTP